MSESVACRDLAADDVTEGRPLDLPADDDVTHGWRPDLATNNMREDWQRADQELRRLAGLRAGLDFEEGRWLLAAWRGGVHVRLGYGSFREYVERLFGYSARLVQDKLRVAEALEGLPVLARTLQSGQACWSVLRELTRVATRETEGEWLAAAAGRTARDVEQLVSGHGLGSRPGDPRDEAARRHVLRFEVSGEVLASIREALAKIRRDAGETRLPRAAQSIPPAIRRLVLRRDHGRCVVPGCRHAIHVDLHHLETRSEGGQHDPDNLITLCGAHHRAFHRGSLIIEGRVSTGLTFRHADGSLYGALVSVARADASVQAFQALRHLGFREGEVRRALGEAAQAVSLCEAAPGGASAGVEALVRECLLRLTERRTRPK